MNLVQSPCVKVCTYDAEAGLCRGCGRSLEEIAAWERLSGCERQKVMDALPQRLRALSRPAS